MTLRQRGEWVVFNIYEWFIFIANALFVAEPLDCRANKLAHNDKKGYVYLFSFSCCIFVCFVLYLMQPQCILISKIAKVILGSDTHLPKYFCGIKICCGDIRDAYATSAISQGVVLFI